MVHVNLEANTFAPTLARRHVAELLRDRGVDRETIEDSCLAVSELATNAVVHTGAAFSLDVSLGGDVVHVEVLDTSPRLPQRIEPTTTNGRGLAIIDRVSRQWGAERVLGGKVIWCDVPVHGDHRTIDLRDDRRARDLA